MSIKKALKVPVVVLIISLLLTSFAACGKEPVEVDVPSSTPTESVATNNEVTFPITDRQIELTYWAPMSSKVAAVAKSYDEIAVYQELEKRTGIKINFLHPAVGQENDQFNLMIASNDLPDMILYRWNSVAGGVSRYISDKQILPLNEAVSKYAPNYNSIIEKNPQAKKEIVTDEGDLFMFSLLKLEDSLKVYKGLQIREDWLKALNLEAPDTLDDWYNVLKAFKENDPNKNGIADEIPFIAQKTSDGTIGDGLTSFFYPFGIVNDFYIDGETVKFGRIEPAFKDALTFLKKLYDEKLIDPEYAITDSKQFEAKVTGNVAGAYYGSLTGHMEKFLTLMKDKDPGFSLMGVPSIKGTDGKRTVISASFTAFSSGMGAAVTTKNQYLEETIKWLDYHYGEEGHMLVNFGIEGQTYNMESGYPKYSDLILKNPDGLSVSDAMGKNILAATDAPIVQDPRYIEQMRVYPAQNEAVNAWKHEIDLSKVLPKVTPTSEESSRFASIMNDIYTYSNEKINAFIMGVEPLENFDKYVEEIKKMGIEEAIQIEQEGLARYNSRK